MEPKRWTVGACYQETGDCHYTILEGSGADTAIVVGVFGQHVDAKRAATAANCHEDLLAALRGLMPLCDDEETRKAYAAEFEAAAQAIAKATGE